MASGKWISGFCENGHHEGTSPVNHKGNPLKVCVIIGENGGLKCNCSCHKKIDEMYETAGLPRVPQQSPLWKPPPNVDLSWVYDESAKNPLDAFVSVGITTNPEHEATPDGPGVRLESPRVTAGGRTPTGIRRRGALEESVQHVCVAFLKGDLPGDDDGYLTTKMISEHIASEEGGDLPSPGAIQSVLTRWQKLGYAEMRKKPVRFHMLTAEGMQKGLSAMKRAQELKTKAARRSKSHSFRG